MHHRNPYDFVPMEGNVQRKAYQINQGIFLEEVSLEEVCEKFYTGIIRCKITTETPFFIGDGSGGYVFFRRGDRYLIPANSLKGMIRSIAEAASNSCLSVVSNEYPGRSPIEIKSRLPKDYWPCEEMNRLCLCCTLFGMTESGEEDKDEKKKALAGRVVFEDATPGTVQIENIKLPARVTKKGSIVPLLDAPKPHHRAFYFENFFQDKEKCLGRKFYYRTTKWKETLKEYEEEYKKGFKNKYREIEFTTVSPGTVFSFHVTFLNLRELELSTLLYALSLSSYMRHHLGYGKPYGLGTVKIEIEWVQLMKRDERLNAPSRFCCYNLQGLESEIWEPMADWHKLAQMAWGDGKDRPNAQTAREKLEEILAWPRDEIFLYPSKKGFFEKSGAERLSLEEYQKGDFSAIETTPALPSAGGKIRGRVKLWKDERGFGFIETDGTEDVFVHIRQVQRESRLEEGWEVEFEIGPGKKPGSKQALKVQVVKKD